MSDHNLMDPNITRHLMYDHLYRRRRTFRQTYRCYSMAVYTGTEPREHVDRGGKIIMPASALHILTEREVVYPMLFKMRNAANPTSRATHAGVLEFVAEEGVVHTPYWLMKNLCLNEGDVVVVENVDLPVGTFARFQPQSPDFLDIHDPKAVLENSLRHMACLSAGDVVAIEYNDKTYELCVLEVKPASAVRIIECDLSVEFAAPVGYEVPKKVAADELDIGSMGKSFVPFSGVGHRLDEKPMISDISDINDGQKVVPTRGIPDYEYQMGTITFNRNPKPIQSTKPQVITGFVAFQGEGKTIK
ncbi:unnamed protein product [Oppiella nova]|uniref:Ubiquitin fusion degradation protein 1 n=1 Tax=Oppiella nova TaxID=334625 RepID=A0A7R9QES4_9ACAR|nr:unnamed protein product [Oppiella nova]CAG2164479.1 unnamed protein product [Oppiella nova]